MKCCNTWPMITTSCTWSKILCHTLAVEDFLLFLNVLYLKILGSLQIFPEQNILSPPETRLSTHNRDLCAYTSSPRFSTIKFKWLTKKERTGERSTVSFHKRATTVFMFPHLSQQNGSESGMAVVFPSVMLMVERVSIDWKETLFRGCEVLGMVTEHGRWEWRYPRRTRHMEIDFLLISKTDATFAQTVLEMRVLIVCEVKIKWTGEKGGLWSIILALIKIGSRDYSIILPILKVIL